MLVKPEENYNFTFAHSWGVSNTHGHSHIEGTPAAGAPNTIYPFASVTKLITSYAILIAVERKMIRLDEPAEIYLSTPPKGTENATLRHFLAHASGVPFEEGETLAPAGTRRIYSNRGIELAGEASAHACGTSIQEWIEESVLIPLGMSSTLVEGSPAHSGSGSLEDLLIFGRELLRPRLISEKLLREAVSVQFPGLTGILPGFGRQQPNDWGLGFELRGSKQPHWLSPLFPAETFGHFGQAGSFLWVDRARGRCGAFLGEKPFSQEHREKWPTLSAYMREVELT